MSRSIGKRLVVKCEICGRKEYKTPSDAKRYKTCSLQCRGERSSKLYTKKVPKECEVCGDVFEVKPSHEANRFTCSESCKYIRLQDHLRGLSGKGNQSVNWKGGKFVSPSGYVFVYAPDNPMANSRGYVREHRLVMSNSLGRPLTDEEIVHHKDENKKNNDLSNLEIMTNGEHTRLHSSKRWGNKQWKGGRLIDDSITRIRRRRFRGYEH